MASRHSSLRRLVARALSSSHPRFHATNTNTTSNTNTNTTKSSSSFLREMLAALLPERQTSALPGVIRGPSPKKADVPVSSSSELAVLSSSNSSSSSSHAEFFSNILRTNPLFRKVNANIQDMQEKWETSDSPFVHRIQDAIDDSFLSQESEAQMASKLIQQRHPGFDMVAFLRGLKEDVPIVIRAYLAGDERAIEEYCSPEMVERLTGIIKHQKDQGLVPDPTLLDASEVELVDLKMLDDDPVVVAQFTCQQINCTRDTHGNVVEGGEEDVQRIYYYWALQMEDQPYVGEDDRVHPPRWRLREMLVRGMHNLL